MTFHIADVDALHGARGGMPPGRRAPGWGERFFHLADPDGHGLGFARPLRPPA